MSTVVLVALLGSAVMHATWNAMAKAITDRLVSSSLIGCVYFVIGAIGVLVLPAPHAAAWPALIVSALLQTAYLILLTAVYSHLDLGVAYPFTRGLAVLGVTVLSVLVLGERLSTVQYAGVAIVITALFALTLGRRRRWPRSGLLLAIAVGACVTAYSFVDGVGVRASGTPLGYAAWLFLLQGAAVPLCALALSRDRRRHLVALGENARIGIVSGILSLAAYTIVLWAQAEAPLALVSALRETGVIAAALIGILVFKERPGPIGIAAAVAATAGIIAVRVGS
ncbi:EamA family transporter [Microbacterium sp. LTA6]|uniref:SMR family transporter n=1 Tax=unclassified Microbacterium TaxID=2609290 RepID=UPI00313A1266